LHVSLKRQAVLGFKFFPAAGHPGFLSAWLQRTRYNAGSRPAKLRYGKPAAV
jgi:hypothetical protein